MATIETLNLFRHAPENKSNSFPAIIRGRDLFSGTYLKKLSVSMVPRDGENLDLRGPPD
jgi:hypothetical protein